MEEVASTFRPRVLDVRLGGLPGGSTASACESWHDDDPVLDGIGRLGGAALALGLCLQDARRGARGLLKGREDELQLVRARRDARELPFVLAVGDAVRRGLPTAARATVAGIAPLSGLFVDGQIGGSLARRLARQLDAMVIRGRTEVRGAVLVLDAEGEVRLAVHEQLTTLNVRSRVQLLREVYGECGGLVLGPAAESGVAYASLANLSDPPSFVGRGGLGARFAASGLCALVVLGDEVAASADGEALRAELKRSPLLFARGVGGTFELLGASAVSDTPHGGDASYEEGVRAARELERQAARGIRQRHACAGCPTACRHVVERASAASKSTPSTQAARFSSTHALGTSLGLAQFDDSLALLAVCDELGIDARAAGAALALLAEAREQGRAPGPKLWGERDACLDELRKLADPRQRSQLAQGARALSIELGMQDTLREAKGLAARPVKPLAALLGQCVSSRGSDPMRSFPFLAESGGDTTRLQALFAPLELPPGSFDPRDPAGKGRLVWWHENLAALIDTSGFCAFSAAGLVGDGLWDLERLALHLAPPSLQPTGRALLAAGATIVLLQRELAALLGGEHAADQPGWAAEELALPGMYDEYAALRGLDARGAVEPEARALLGHEALLDLGLSRLAPVVSAVGIEDPAERRPGTVQVRAFGALGDALQQEGAALRGRFSLDGHYPLRVAVLLEVLASAYPEQQALITCAAVHRAGALLSMQELVHDGDVLDLVVAISGG